MTAVGVADVSWSSNSYLLVYVWDAGSLHVFLYKFCFLRPQMRKKNE